MDTFPDPLIAQAYTAPQIDSSTQRFEWGLPDIDEIKYYMRDKSGWTAEKVDQIILPVVKEMANRAAPQQTTLDRFFHVQQPSPAKDKFKSIRMKTAIDKMGKVDEIKGSIIKSRSRGRGSGRGRGRGDHRGKGK